MPFDDRTGKYFLDSSSNFPGCNFTAGYFFL